jgi:hypothetical protein
MTDCGKVTLMGEDDARAIVEFALTHAEADLFIIHCEAGISRSRSVAEALFDAFGRRAPNQYIYRQVLDAFREMRSSQGAQRRPTASVGNDVLDDLESARCSLWIDFRWVPPRRGPR